MKIFVVVVLAGVEAYHLVTRLVRESGAEIYNDADEFSVDGVQDPYRAVDEVDALVWVYRPQSSLGAMVCGASDYNYLYADTVMERAVRTGKPVLYYFLKQPDIDVPSPAIMRRVARRAYVETLSELEIKLQEDLRDLVAGRIPFYDPDAPSIFISYTHTDKPFARQLKNDLQLAGARVWIDEGEILVGDSLIEAIRRGIDETDFFGVILSPESVNSRWVQRELDVAMNKEIDGQFVRVLPLVHKKCELPGFLKGKQYADFSEDYNHALSQLLRRLGLPDFEGGSV